MNKKVRVGTLYKYYPVPFDMIRPPFGNPHKGQIVKVVNKFGCPPANTMGMCYINSFPEDKFLGMVCTNSLISVKSGAIKKEAWKKVGMTLIEKGE
jgi:hypothetical protein